MARTNKDLFIASPLEFAQSCRVMIGGLATLTECLLVLHARPEVACRYWAGRVALRNCARQHRRAGPRRSELARRKINRLKSTRVVARATLGSRPRGLGPLGYGWQPRPQQEHEGEG